MAFLKLGINIPDAPQDTSTGALGSGDTVLESARGGSTYLTPDRSVSVDGTTVHYRASLTPGSTATLVLIHGLGASLESWCDVHPRLAAEFSVVRIDLKGSGHSSKPDDAKYSSRDQARLLADFIAAIGLTDVVLIGHSFGGAVALLTHLETADQTPSRRISGLVLINSAGYAQKVPWFVRGIRSPAFRGLAFVTPPWLIARFVLKRFFFVKSRVTRERIDRYAYFFDLPGSLEAFISTAQQIVPADAESIERQFSSIRVPTLIIWGANDPVIPLSHAHRFHADIAGSELRILEDTGHVPHEERPDVVADLISGFVAGLNR
jgi:pimeloyl-ACP methyl ester carboxylesterase